MKDTKPKTKPVTISGMREATRRAAQRIANRHYRGNLSAYVCAAVQADLDRIRVTEAKK